MSNRMKDPYVAILQAHGDFRHGDFDDGLAGLREVPEDPKMPEEVRQRFREKLAPLAEGLAARDRALVERALFGDEPPIPMEYINPSIGGVNLSAKWDEAVREALDVLRRP